MNHRAITALLLGATALLIFPLMPRASAQETLSYWYYQPGSGGTRQPRTGTSGHFVRIAGPTTVGGALAPNSTVAVQTSMPSSYPSPTPGLHYALAYISITGGIEGGMSVFPDAGGTLPLTVNVTLPGTPNPQIAVNVYYFPVGGGPCPPGQVCGAAYIDEFGDLQGTLLNDTFVNVYIPPSATPNPGLTNSGNVNGTVSTGSNAVRINALATTPTGGSFDRWVSGGGTVSGNDLNVGHGAVVYALALYDAACPNGYYRNPSATISQCSRIPPCPTGQYWNTTTHSCATPNTGCPKSCIYGCFPPRIGPHGEPPVAVCRPQPGTCLAVDATNGCAANQYCLVHGTGGTNCNCLKCAPVKVE